MARPARTDGWYALAGGLFIACLAVTAYAAHRYASAEAHYRQQLGHVTLQPHGDPLATLEAATRTADNWLHAEIIAAIATGLAAINLLVWLGRHRAARLAASDADRSDD